MADDRARGWELRLTSNGAYHEGMIHGFDGQEQQDDA